MKTIFVSYFGLGHVSDDRSLWQRSQQSLADSAIRYGEMDAVNSWSDTDLQKTAFYRDNKQLLDQPKGAGYWLWKPWAILQSLEALDDGDVVIYHDVGRPDRPHGTGHRPHYQITRSLKPVVALCVEKGGIMPGMYLSKYQNRQWVKRDCFVLMDCDSPDYWDGVHVSSSFSAWQNNEETRKFVAEWLELCRDPRLIDDTTGHTDAEALDGFQQHRHDQAILSLLVARDRVPCFGDPERLQYRFRNINFLAKAIETNRAMQVDRPRLAEIGKRHGTDKVRHGFTGTYQYWMEERRDEAVRLLEIGVFYGASLKMWREYFPQGEIHGMDWFAGLNGNLRTFPDAERFLREHMESPERITLHKLDQGHRSHLEGFVEMMTEQGIAFDYIIDDGSHLMRDQQLALGMLFPLLKPGGLFIVEDIHSSRQPEGYADIRPDLGNTTLNLLQGFHKSLPFDSMFLSRAENGLLNEQVDDVCTFWHRKGASGTTVVIKRMDDNEV